MLDAFAGTIYVNVDGFHEKYFGKAFSSTCTYHRQADGLRNSFNDHDEHSAWLDRLKPERSNRRLVISTLDEGNLVVSDSFG